jgi:hypothetical protein
VNKRKKTQAALGKEHAISQPTASRILSEAGQLKQRLILAQSKEREAKASLAELLLKHRRGLFIEAELVKKDGEDTGERVLSVLRSIPQRTAAALECDCTRAASVEAKISSEIERAVSELRESLYIKPPGE